MGGSRLLAEREPPWGGRSRDPVDATRADCAAAFSAISTSATGGAPSRSPTGYCNRRASDRNWLAGLAEVLEFVHLDLARLCYRLNENARQELTNALLGRLRPKKVFKSLPQCSA